MLRINPVKTIDYGRVMEKLVHLSMMQTMGMKMVIKKMICRHKREETRRQIKPETETSVEVSSRWQGRPSVIRFIRPPRYPGWPPSRIGGPHPAIPCLEPPAPIMKWSPAPGVIGLPIPSSIGIEPSAAVAIWRPVRIGFRNSRLPNPTLPIDVEPGTIRSKVLVKRRNFRRRTSHIALLGPGPSLRICTELPALLR